MPGQGRASHPTPPHPTPWNLSGDKVMEIREEDHLSWVTSLAVRIPGLHLTLSAFKGYVFPSTTRTDMKKRKNRKLPLVAVRWFSDSVGEQAVNAGADLSACSLRVHASRGKVACARLSEQM